MSSAPFPPFEPRDGQDRCPAREERATDRAASRKAHRADHPRPSPRGSTRASPRRTQGWSGWGRFRRLGRSSALRWVFSSIKSGEARSEHLEILSNLKPGYSLNYVFLVIGEYTGVMGPRRQCICSNVRFPTPLQLARVGDILICSGSGSRSLIRMNAFDGLRDSHALSRYGEIMTGFRSPHNYLPCLRS